MKLAVTKDQLLFVLGLMVFLLLLPRAAHGQKLVVIAGAHDTQESDFTTTTPAESNTNCAANDTSVNCRTTTYGGTTQQHAIYRLTQWVTADQNGQTIRYKLERTARWRWSSTDWLTEGESFPAEIKGKHMEIECRKGGNQGKKETLKYDILDIRQSDDGVAVRITYCIQNPEASITPPNGQTQTCTEELAKVKAICTVNPQNSFCQYLAKPNTP
jgi:hypothetical protein